MFSSFPNAIDIKKRKFKAFSGLLLTLSSLRGPDSGTGGCRGRKPTLVEYSKNNHVLKKIELTF